MCWLHQRSVDFSNHGRMRNNLRFICIDKQFISISIFFLNKIISTFETYQYQNIDIRLF